MKPRIQRPHPSEKKRKLRIGSAPPITEAEPIVYYPESSHPSGEMSEEASPASSSSWVVPVWWVNTVIGVFLLPAVWILTKTFFVIFSQETIDHQFWATEEFWFFGLGAILWLISFFGLPRPTLLYVFGHELTHAIWVWLMGGYVDDFEVKSTGGYVLTNKQNVWISLSPYFYPIYSVAVVILYGVASMFWDVAPYTRWLFLALGVTWCFHITFTAWMIPKGQSDLTHHGTFFSLVVIYLMNLLLISALGILAAPQATLKGFMGELFDNTVDFSYWALTLLRALAGAI